MRLLLFCLGCLLITVPEILRVYYIMPFPDSQEDVPTDLRQVNIAYWLHNNIWWVRLVGLTFLIGPFIHYVKRSGVWTRLVVLVPVAFGALVIYAFNFKFMADKMFLPPKNKVMQPPVLTDSTGNDLAISVEHNGDARAYPIELIGYHHQVDDTVGGKPVLVTYCTVCRTGRVWDPTVDGRQEHFRLVGMDHFNAMFEDSRTGSWWRQATGECIAGPLKGQTLTEVPSQQMTLSEFVEAHPQGLVMQPDGNFAEQYKGLAGFDEGTIDSELEYRDTASWQPKSWVVGVVHNGVARAYDWNELLRLGEIADTLGGDTITVSMPVSSVHLDSLGWMHMARDSSGFEVLLLSTTPLERLVDPTTGEETDAQTTSRTRILSYQEFWHSWRTFHPNTTRYVPER
ncbi:MAG: DUF3179 domain-containing protein [Flavobacteriales bacterium]|nr:MAG: DUF3179 domain-containing protein [Flavobacteriales bacterium]